MDQVPIPRWSDESGSRLAELLLAWYDGVKRDLPWRRSKDPYRIWLSEIMLQQTQVATVIPYFELFLQRWPTMRELAQAHDDQVLKAWEGLGYYSRARNLLACARECCDRNDCQMPEAEKDRLTLPGIGDYTAAAIGAIAFGQPVAAVDGNIVRVFARLTATAWNPTDLSQRREVRRLAESVLPPARAGDFNEALMDLGATICTPRQPRCGDCPVAGLCQAKAQDLAGSFPVRPVRKERPLEVKTVLILVWKGKVHVKKRPPRGLLANLHEFDWLDELPCAAGKTPGQLFPDSRIESLGSMTHEFTHKRWALEGYLVWLPHDPGLAHGFWSDPAGLKGLAFPAALNVYLQEIVARLPGGSEF